MVYASRDMFEADEPAAPAVLGAEEDDEQAVGEVAEQEPAARQEGVGASD